MAEIDRVIGHLTGSLEAIELRLGRIENKMDVLQSDLDQRRGGVKVFYAMASIVGAVAGVGGGYLHDFIINS